MKASNVYEAYYLGEFDVLDNELSVHKLASFSSVFTNPDQFAVQLKTLELRKELQTEHLAKLVSLSHNMKSSWCSTIYKIVSVYEYYSDSLQREIASRKAKNVSFTPHELMRIAYDLIDVLAYLQTNNTVNYTIVPSLIYLYDDVALNMKRAKLIERLNFNKSKKTNLVSAVALGLEIYPDPEYFEWYMRSEKPMEVQNHYK